MDAETSRNGTTTENPWRKKGKSQSEMKLPYDLINRREQWGGIRAPFPNAQEFLKNGAKKASSGDNCSMYRQKS